MKFLISSTYFLQQLKKFDFDEDHMESIQVINDHFIKLVSNQNEVEINVHIVEYATIYFDVFSVEFKRLIGILKAIPEQPITVFLQHERLYIKMIF